MISNNLYSFIVLYRSPRQSTFSDVITTFSDNFEMTLNLDSKENPFSLVVLGDFIAKLSQWHDEDSTISEEDT